MEQPKQLILPLELVNATLQYLGSQPYDQVAQLIQEFHKQAQPFESTENVKEIKEDKSA